MQRPMIDFASQMETLNRMNIVAEEEKRPVLLLTKSEKELRLINRNREALDKRDEMLAQQNVDIESSFESSRLPEDKRSVEKQIRACLLDSIDIEIANPPVKENDNISDLTKKNKKVAEIFEQKNEGKSEVQSENIDTSVQVTEKLNDSVVILDAKDIHGQFTSNLTDEDNEIVENYQSYADNNSIIQQMKAS